MREIYDNTSKQLYITWNIAVRRLYDLLRIAHTKLLNQIPGVPHAKLNLKCMSINGSNVSNMLCEYNITIFDIINGSTSNLIEIAYTCFNAIPDEQW